MITKRNSVGPSVAGVIIAIALSAHGVASVATAHAQQAGAGADAMTWTTDELSKIIAADDLHISPFREDGVTYGTPTWIWCVAVDGSLYEPMISARTRAATVRIVPSTRVP